MTQNCELDKTFSSGFLAKNREPDVIQELYFSILPSYSQGPLNKNCGCFMNML